MSSCAHSIKPPSSRIDPSGPQQQKIADAVAVSPLLAKTMRSIRSTVPDGHSPLVATPHEFSLLLIPVQTQRSPTPGLCRLAAWQISRIVTYVNANLDAPICTADLSAMAHLSPFHFCRVFRNSMGISPHQYVMRTRIERARHLMLTTTAPLGQIAVDCGLADQAHLTRLFRRFIGKPPSAWRRAHASIIAID